MRPLTMRELVGEAIGLALDDADAGRQCRAASDVVATIREDTRARLPGEYLETALRAYDRRYRGRRDAVDRRHGAGSAGAHEQPENEAVAA
jgi:hypothetical protein